MRAQTHARRKAPLSGLAVAACIVGAICVFAGSFLLASHLFENLLGTSEEDIRAEESLSISDRANRYESPYNW